MKRPKSTARSALILASIAGLAGYLFGISGADRDLQQQARAAAPTPASQDKGKDGFRKSIN